MNNLLGYILICQTCGETFVICKRCYRGHKYCSNSCRETGYELARKKARKKYDSTEEAKLDRRDRAKKYRLQSKENVTDKTSKKINIDIQKHSHEHYHELINEVQSKNGECISCKIIIFEKGVPTYDRSV